VSFALLLLPLTSSFTFVPSTSLARPNTVLRAEETDYEAEIAKLQAEAEQRMKDKVNELEKDVESVGKE